MLGTGLQLPRLGIKTKKNLNPLLKTGKGDWSSFKKKMKHSQPCFAADTSETFEFQESDFSLPSLNNIILHLQRT